MYFKRKASSIVELVVVVLIIAVLSVILLAGGSSTISKSRETRTTTDLQNFRLAIESALIEYPSCLNIDNNNLSEGNMLEIVQAVNKNLAVDYQIEDIYSPLSNSPAGSKLSIQIVADVMNTGNYLVYQSKKLDAWDNPYYIIFDASNLTKASDFHILVASAGANGISYIGKLGWDEDDVLLYIRDRDNNISSQIYSHAGIGESYFQAIGGAKIIDENDSVSGKTVVNTSYNGRGINQYCKIGTTYTLYSNIPLCWLKISNQHGGWNTFQHYGAAKNVIEFTMVENSHIGSYEKQYIFAGKNGQSCMSIDDYEKACIIVIPKP